jgi:hypothetical protein
MRVLHTTRYLGAHVMSEQFAMPHENIDSTNNRLDSILDRLNALGSSADALKTVEPAAVPPLGLVPPPSEAPFAPALDPNVIAAVVQPVVPTPVQIDPIELASEIDSTLAAIPPPIVEVSPVIAEIAELSDPPQIPDLPDLPPLTYLQTPESPAIDVSHDAPHGEFDLGEPEFNTDLDDPDPAALEYQELELDGADVEPGELVFELGEPLDDPPVSAASVFETTSAEGTEDETTAIDEGDTGWVSHEKSIPISQTAFESGQAFEAPEFFRSEILEPEEAPDAQAPCESESDEGATTETAPVDDVHDLFLIEDAVTDEEHSSDQTDPFGTTEASEGSDHVVGTNLAQLDFAGIYPDPATDGVEDQNDILQVAVASIETSAMTQEDLDLLRPDEEAIAEDASNTNSIRKQQLVMVVLFGLIALAVIYLDDPAAVDSLRESLNSLRN